MYDGDCAMCTRSAGFIGRRLPAGVAVRPSSDLDLEALGLTLVDVTRAAWWVQDGVRFGGHLAVGRALRAAGGLWRIPGWMACTPPTSWLAVGVYRLVARNRHRLPGGTAACRIDAPRSAVPDPPTAGRGITGGRPGPASRWPAAPG